MDLTGRHPVPRAAYVHVPFCRHRCGYCNFTVVAGRDDLIDDYLKALSIELSQLETPRAVDTLFLGGGTPTQLPYHAWQTLLQLVTDWFPLSDGGEWSIEANPEDVTANKVASAAAAGVTRWSLGVQSFGRRKLSVLERAHDEHTVKAAIETCGAAGAQVAIDLMFAAPNETLTEWHQDLDAAVNCGVDHISTYGLTYEKGTAFWSRRARSELAAIDEELERAMYVDARERLRAAGFEHYEISNFARPGCRCRHNETYWACRPYFAVGPGAARYVDGRREVNHRSTTTWMRRLLRGESPVAESEYIDPELAAREQLVFGLRRLEGIDTEAFAAETGLRVEQLCGPYWERYLEDGWWQQIGKQLSLTDEGILISDSLWPPLLQRSSTA